MIEREFWTNLDSLGKLRVPTESSNNQTRSYGVSSVKSWSSLNE
jgi:hypothetical protein